MSKTVVSKSELVHLLALKTNVSQKDVKRILDSIMDTVKIEVQSNAEIRLIGFGTFKKVHRTERKGRNPQTGEEITIQASDSLAFKSSVKY